MDRIDSVAVFAEVAERGSFSGAAKHLNRSAAAVTRAVAELEARLGVRLLNRTTRAVSVTEAGQRFLVGARRVLADLAEIEQGAAGQGQAPRGELRITAPIVFGRRHVLPLVTDFLGQYPEVSVRLALLDRPVDLVDDGLDAAIRIGTLADTSAIAVRVGEMRRIAVASPGYLERRGRPKSVADLAGHDVIAFAGIDRVERWRFAGGVEARIKPRLVVNTAEAAIDAAVAGFGITRVLSYQAADALSDQRLVRLLREHEAGATPVHVVYPEGRHPPPKLRAFLDAIVPRLRQRCSAIARSVDK
ncbi:MAG: LysR family transcriptional regulator [Xanthobacteraceae bacterium]|nr:LysR family transcriptional regulator [Xanthobacteraceae bacterium]